MKKPRPILPCLSEVETALNTLLRTCEASVLVRQKAFEIYNAQNKQHPLKEHSPKVAAKAVTYTAQRLCRVPQALSQLGVNSSKEKRRVLRCYTDICKALGIVLPRLQGRDYLTFLATKKKIDKEVERGAREILIKAREKHMVRGTNPAGLVAAAIYFASRMRGKKLTQRELAEAAGVSEPTIRANYRILKLIGQSCRGRKR